MIDTTRLQAVASSISNDPLFISTGPDSSTPSTLPYNCYVQEDNLFVGGWQNRLLRFFVPFYASAQDSKVSEFFIHYFQEFFEKEPLAANRENGKKMLILAEQHIARGKGWFSSQTQDTCRLEHYTLVARQKLNLFEPGRPEGSLIEKCRSDNKALLSKWKKLGFAEEAFMSCPDLVDFVFRSFLHRHIAHPYYKHTIDMRLALVRREGRIESELQPHILVDGRPTPWSEIRKKIKIDKEERLYSTENGHKKYWTYLDEGLTQWDKNNFDNPHRLCKLDRPPLRSRVEVITTHAHKEDWHIGDRLLKGTRHSFFRIVPGEGFSARHPNARLENGALYSLGWGPRWHEFSFFRPLATLQGRWFCPDNFEFVKEDLCITPVQVTDEQVLSLLESVKRRTKEENPFHVVTANCCGATADVLNEPGIVNLSTKNHMAYMWYKFLLPKKMRKPLDKIAEFFEWITPSIITQGILGLGAFAYSVIFAPIFTLLGAWRTTLSYEDEDGNTPGRNTIQAKAANRIKALFSNVFDLFSPSKMEFDLTKNIFKWQRRQSQSYFEKRD